MKLYAFSDMPFKVQDRYNEWAKDKHLARDVIIQSHITFSKHPNGEYAVATIFVFFDEKLHPDW